MFATIICMVYSIHWQRNILILKGGFTHVPFIPAQVARRTPVAPYMVLEDIRRGLEAAIVDIDKNFDADINVNGGKEF